MVPTYQHQTQVVVTVDYPSVDGGVIVPTGVSYELLDEVGTVLATETVNVEEGVPGTQLSIVVEPTDNVVPEGATRSVRVIRTTFEAPTGRHVTVNRYVIEKAQLLVTMTNSFQTYEEAILTRMDLPAFDGWDSSDEEAHIPALVTAHDRMCRLTYRYRMSSNAVMYDEDDPYWLVTGMRLMKPEDFAKWPNDFKSALRRAQLYEADQVLKGDPVGDKRRSGVVSETIGESKMFFNSRPPLRLALCVQAMETLGPYLHSSRRIGRA